MYLTELLESVETLSVFEKFAQIFWGDVFTWKDLFEFIGAVSGVAVIVFGPIRWLKNCLLKISAPYRAYKDDIDAVLGKKSRERIEKYYIPTRGQDVDPCNEEEIRENNGKYNTEKLIPFLCKKAFGEDSFGKHYLILADSGMGKTTFLVNLYRYYVLKKRFWSKNRKNMRYIPLSSKTCMKQIATIDNQGNTILLLDALDESEAAMTDCDAFLDELLKQTEGFYRIVITCRTHFFLDAKHEPDNTGLVRPGIGDKNLKFTKKYITPFNDDEVNEYLRKRFRFRFIIQSKAKKIVNKVPSIMARPLILNWIDLLVETDTKFEYTYEIYETIINRWIKREPEEHTKGKLLELSKCITRWMLEHATTHIPATVVEKMANEEGIDLMPIVAQSRSLLNRNSAGEYKYAHRSFLEYFLSEQVFESGLSTDKEEYLHSMSGFRRFFVERLEEDTVVAMDMANKLFDEERRLRKSVFLISEKTLEEAHRFYSVYVYPANGTTGFTTKVVYLRTYDLDKELVSVFMVDYVARLCEDRLLWKVGKIEYFLTPRDTIESYFQRKKYEYMNSKSMHELCKKVKVNKVSLVPK